MFIKDLFLETSNSSISIFFSFFQYFLLITFCHTHQGDGDEAQPSTKGDESSKELVNNDDEPMASEDDNANKTKAKTEISRQNEKLYSAEGILNTKMKRAEKKRRKKAAKVDTMDGDYDFKVDYKKGSAMNVEDRSGKMDDDSPIPAVVPMSGIQCDDE